MEMETITVRFFAAALLALAAFWSVGSLLPISLLVAICNGMLVGVGVALAIAYGPLILSSVFKRPYDRVRQMTIGIFLLWIALALPVSGSIYQKMADLPNQNTMMVASGRFVAIIAAILQVTAPDFGKGMLYGRDRKMLAVGILTGAITAWLVTVGQTEMILAP